MHPSIHGKNNPDKIAYVIADKNEAVTYGELNEASNRLAHLFRQKGLMPGDHLALFMENNKFFFQVVWAAQRAGLIFTAISSHLKSDEVAYIIENCDAKVFVASQKLKAEAVAAIEQVTTDPCCFMVKDSAEQFLSLEQSMEKCPVTPIEDECAGIQMLYSSGTTGSPKGIYPNWEAGRPITHLEPGMQMLTNAFGLDDNVVYLSPAPLYHAAPLIYNMLVMHQGGTSIIMERFDAEQSLKLIEQYKVTIAQWVPIMFVRLLKLDKTLRERFDISSMKIAIHAAAPCPKDIKQQMINWWGPILVEYYSSTENAGATILSTEQWLQHPGSVGLPLGCEVHILDEDGNTLPPGEVGEVYFDNPNSNFEYYKEPGKTQETRNQQGWVTIGDMGYVDEDGYLYLTDRKNFMIISGGVNIYPQEVENLLITHNDVADVAVFGIPCEEFGERVHAVIQPANWDNIQHNSAQIESELIAWCKSKLSAVKTPKAINFAQMLPRLDNGKLYKQKLVAEYASNNK